MKSTRWLIALAFLFMGCASFIRQAGPEKQQSIQDWKLDETLPFDPSITVGTMANGLRYYIRPNERPENRMELHLAVNAGSVLEEDDQQGLAHFAEHMAFNGTAHFEKQAMIDFLESIGMRFGPEINASTGFDQTVYTLELPTDSLEILESAFQILADWAHGVRYDSVEIEKERGVIIEEWRLGRGAEARMLDKQLPILFKDSQYANRLPIGNRAVLDTFHHESLRRFYETWYRPDLMAVIAVGDFDRKHIEDMIHIYFSKIPRPFNAKPRPDFPIPDHRETRFAIATDPEATHNSISIYFKKDLKPETTIGDYRRMLLENLYDGMLNDRLIELTREADPPYLYALAGSGRFVRTKGVYTLSASVKENGLLLGLKTLLIESERVRRFGFTQTELERKKKEMLRGIQRAYEERDKIRSSRLASEYARNFLVQEPVPGLAFEYALYQRFLPEITLNEVNALSAATLTDSNRVILVDAPEKEGVHVPTEEELMAVFESVRSLDVQPYVDQVLDVPLVERPPEPGSIVHKTSIDTLGVTEWTLSNGIRVVMKPTNFKNDEIRFSSFSPGGHSLIPDSLYIPAITATSLVMESGLGPFTQIELEKQLAGKAVRVSPGISALTERVSGSASPKDLETLFQLIYLTFTEPKVDSTAFKSFKSRIQGYIENRSADPNAAYSDTIQVTTAQYHFRSRPWSKSLLDEMDLLQSLAYYQDRFSDASDFTFFFVGNFEPDSIAPLVKTYLGGLPSIQREETWKDLGIIPPDGLIQKNIRKGIEPKSRVRLIFTGPAEWSRQNNYEMDSMIGVLRIRLREVIREDMSGTYGVSVSGGLSRIPREEYTLSVSFGCDPDRVDELTSMVFNQLDSLAQSGPDSLTVSKIQETQRRRYETQLKENGFWLDYLYQTYFFNEDPLRLFGFLDRVDTLTTEVVRKTLKKYYTKEHYMKFVLLPEEK